MFNISELKRIAMPPRGVDADCSRHAPTLFCTCERVVVLASVHKYKTTSPPGPPSRSFVGGRMQILYL